MKKVLLSVLTFIGLTAAVNAQDISDNAIGLRLGGFFDNYGGELSYQRGLSQNNRLELDLGWRNNNSIQMLTGIYQWVWQIEDRLNWYAGVGGGMGSWNNSLDNSGTFIFVAGDIGIEYILNEAPIQLSLDVRPELGNDYYKNDYGYDIAIGIRYQF